MLCLPILGTGNWELDNKTISWLSTKGYAYMVICRGKNPCLSSSVETNTFCRICTDLEKWLSQSSCRLRRNFQNLRTLCEEALWWKTNNPKLYVNWVYGSWQWAMGRGHLMGLMTRAGTGLPTPAGPHVWGLMFCGQHPVILSKLPLNLCFVSKVRWAKACGWGRGLRSSSRAATVSSPPQDLLSAPGSPGPWKLKCAIILF